MRFFNAEFDTISIRGEGMMSEKQVVVNVQRVEKHFKRKRVIRKLSMQVQQGEIFGLLGPSGCGKTTVIKMIMGMLKSTGGTIELLQTSMPNREVLTQIGYMAQADALYTELTARENLQFFAKQYWLSKRERMQRIHYTAELVQLTQDLDTVVKHFSGGMKRRLSLAIALLHNPEIIILDEPTVGIDPILKKNIWQEFERLRADGKTIIVTTHVMDEAERCDRVGLLQNGYLLALGTPQEVKAEYNAQSFDEVFYYAGGGQI